MGYIVRHALSPFAGLGDEFGNDYADGPVRRVRLDSFRDAACLVQEIGVFLYAESYRCLSYLQRLVLSF